ncbi:alpha/beta hydrolase [Phenylobacterium sp.]|uniref:alpha/beta fold hydrolase n=1 Tax=Phenylobacterium sp. TaxID=1871053 RepID=UPI002F3F4190
MPEFRTIDTGRARIRAVVQGEGPLVLMVHGFPESWYSWRHQIGPIAQAGFTACAIDVRGYGGSQRFDRVEDYAMEQMIADILGVGHALSPNRRFVLLGHDWGAPMVWQTSLIHADRVAAVAALSVIHSGVPEQSFDDTIKAIFDDRNKFFYQSYFRPVGLAEGVFDANPRDFLRRFYYLGSGEFDLSTYPADKTSSDALLDGLPDPDPFPGWLTEADLDYYVAEFEGSGFFGPLSRYRNHTQDWAFLLPYKDRKVQQPALFIAGDRDGAYTAFGMAGDPLATLRANVPNLQGAHILPGCGHWTQQERPAEVNAALIPWLKSLKDRLD